MDYRYKYINLPKLSYMLICKIQLTSTYKTEMGFWKILFMTLNPEFFSQNGSWETIFSKSSENICENEFNCCRRIVQLCRDCLLIVYQFAAEAKSTSQQNSENTDLSSAG